MAQISSAALYKKLGARGHKHFCSDRACRQVYDCTAAMFLQGGCPSPEKNGRCARCRDLVVPTYYEIAAPRPCCRDNVTQLTDRNELLSYRLAGPGPWFKCKTCARTNGWPQGYKPTNN